MSFSFCYHQITIILKYANCNFTSTHNHTVIVMQNDAENHINQLIN